VQVYNVNTGGAGADGDELPLDPPALAWSINADGEADAALLARRDKTFDVDRAEVREHRQELQSLARPQRGVNALADKFPGRSMIPGVRDRGDGTEAAAGAVEPSGGSAAE
jgi:hypothetical protein